MTLDRLFSIIGDDGRELIDLIHKKKIFDCLKRVSRGIDRFDRDLFLSAYHEDAIIDAGALVGGPATVFDGGAALHEDGQSATLHHLTNHSCDIDGDVAHCETYYFYVGRNRNGTNWIAGGRYIDRVEQRAGEWRIAFRQTVIEYSGIVEANEVPLFAHASNEAANGVPARDRTDPSYRRPHINLKSVSVPGNIKEFGRV